jgi:hypothetical protein
MTVTPGSQPETAGPAGASRLCKRRWLKDIYAFALLFTATFPFRRIIAGTRKSWAAQMHSQPWVARCPFLDTRLAETGNTTANSAAREMTAQAEEAIKERKPTSQTHRTSNAPLLRDSNGTARLVGLPVSELRRNATQWLTRLAPPNCWTRPRLHIRNNTTGLQTLPMLLLGRGDHTKSHGTTSGNEPANP